MDLSKNDRKMISPRVVRCQDAGMKCNVAEGADRVDKPANRVRREKKDKPAAAPIPGHGIKAGAVKKAPPALSGTEKGRGG